MDLRAVTFGMRLFSPLSVLVDYRAVTISSSISNLVLNKNTQSFSPRWGVLLEFGGSSEDNGFDSRFFTHLATRKFPAHFLIMTKSSSRTTITEESVHANV